MGFDWETILDSDDVGAAYEDAVGSWLEREQAEERAARAEQERQQAASVEDAADQRFMRHLWKGRTRWVEAQWGGHRFTDAEIEALLAGEEVTFIGTRRDGRRFEACGTYRRHSSRFDDQWRFVRKAYRIVD